MPQTIDTEVLLAGVYAVFLLLVACGLELLARHAHHRSKQMGVAGFKYHRHHDVWECPTGRHLTREQTDFERKVARYRAPAHQCNVCHCKKDCTGSNDGRLLESRLDAWLQSELSRFHRGVSLTLLLLAVIILTIEMFRYQTARDWMMLLVLLLPIGLSGSRYFVFFSERTRKH